MGCCWLTTTATIGRDKEFIIYNLSSFRIVLCVENGYFFLNSKVFTTYNEEFLNMIKLNIFKLTILIICSVQIINCKILSICHHGINY